MIRLKIYALGMVVLITGVAYNLFTHLGMYFRFTGYWFLLVIPALLACDLIMVAVFNHQFRKQDALNAASKIRKAPSAAPSKGSPPKGNAGVPEEEIEDDENAA